jgi:CxxC motif-containing protein (DUF1111 family)
LTTRTRFFSDATRALLALLIVAGSAAAEPLADLHLKVQPRSAAERERIAAATALPSDLRPLPFEALPGGLATVRRTRTADAFSQPSASLDPDGEMRFKLGNALFRRNWVAAPSSTIASDGLGPLYNARACQACHLKDGRGQPPEGPGDPGQGIFLRISVPAPDEGDTARIRDYLATVPDPVYGGQLQDRAGPGIPAEYALAVTWTEAPVALSGGDVAHLRRPDWRAEGLGYGPLHPDAMLSPRLAPQMIGLGLLEAIPAEDILAWAEPDGDNADGISGRPNIVLSAEFGRPMLVD